MVLGFRRLLAWSAILAFAGTFGLGAGTFGHYGPDDDAACRQDARAAGHSGPRLQNASTIPSPTHCPFCHWQRMVSGASIVSADFSAAPLDPVDTVLALATRTVGSAAVDERPSRAPPAQLI